MAAVHSASSHPSPPPLTQSDAVTSLLSLGMAAANDSEDPASIPISGITSISSISTSTSNEALASSHTTTIGTGSLGSSSITATTTSGSTGKHHRRLGSTGKTRRRLSDAREASTRPLTQHSLLSLASLSLSTSPGALSSKPLAPRPTSQSTISPSGISITGNSTPVAIPVTLVSESTVKPESSDKDRNGFNKTPSSGSTPIPITTNGKQKKRGVDYRCESCAKIYRHPNCLNKHRWEHTRQWREASKFVLSKHQQVQLLEAATILSYMGTASTSLPEDRSEWPSFLSGGSLPKPEPAGSIKDKESKTTFGSLNNGNNMAGNGEATTTQPVRSKLSTSVPVRMSASVSHGPRMHDFTHPTTGASVVVGPLSNSFAQGRIIANGANFPATSNAGSGPFMRPLTPPPLLATNTVSSGLSDMMMMMDQPGWISHIPSSSIRSESSESGSGSRSRSGSLSGSRSRSRSDGSEPEIEEEEDGDVDVEIMEADADTGDDEKMFGVQDSRMPKDYPPFVASSRPIEAVPVSYNVNVDGYPHGSYGSPYGRHGVVQGGSEYGSYTSSSFSNTNATSNGTLGSFAGFSSRVYTHRTGAYPSSINTAKPTDHYGNNDYASISRALRGSTSTVMSQREEEVEDINRTRHANNDNYVERHWDGMEMEMEMD